MDDGDAEVGSPGTAALTKEPGAGRRAVAMVVLNNYEWPKEPYPAGLLVTARVELGPPTKPSGEVCRREW